MAKTQGQTLRFGQNLQGEFLDKKNMFYLMGLIKVPNTYKTHLHIMQLSKDQYIESFKNKGGYPDLAKCWSGYQHVAKH